MRPVREYAVRGRFARWMRRHKWTGVCLPLPFVTVILYWLREDDDEVDRATVRGGRSRWLFTPDYFEPYAVHERAHARQAERLGWLRWWCLYLWETARRGYRLNRLEVEAYAEQRKAREALRTGPAPATELQ